MLEIDKAHLRGIWVASECRYGFYRFTLDPFSHCVSLWLISTVLLPHGSVIAGFWMVSRICENVARAACTLWSRGSWLWGASVSALCRCCFLAHRFVWHCRVVAGSLLFSHAIPIPEVIQCYHLFWYVSDDHELTCWSPAVRFFWVVFGLFVFVFLLLVWLSCVGCEAWRWQLNGLCIDPCSVLLLVIWECCHCINSLNLPICISFPAWLTTWREPQGVGQICFVDHIGSLLCLIVLLQFS